VALLSDVQLAREELVVRYVSLHHHSTFSYLDGYGMPEAHVRRATELDMGSIALTDHGNVSGHVKLEMAAEAAGVKPIYGCELYTGAVGDDRTQRKNHLTVLASDERGYRSLLRTVSQGWSDFYYEPTVSGETLAEHKEGLVVLSGCTGSLLATSLVGGKNVPEDEASYTRGKNVARRFKKAFGDAYYLEVQAFPELEQVCRINEMMVRLSEELKIPMVATGDVHYTKPDENELQQILHNVRGGNRQSLEDQARSWGYNVPLSPPLTDREMLRRLTATGIPKQAAINAILATEDIADRCNGVKLPKLPRLRFPYQQEGFGSAQECWESWIKDGWKYRGCDRMSKEKQRAYRAKIKYEMGIIEEKDFIDYFLIVSDIVKFAKDSGIPVGPARGSAAASLVCYLLRITEVDPMLFPSLVFERFIDISRQDLPDIDLDFDSERRIEIREYAVRKYGRECVSNIGTFTYYKSKNSLDDVARVYKIPKFEVETVKNLLLERSSGDLRASATIEDTFDQFDEAKAVLERFPDLSKAMRLEGNVKGMGVHAAGLIISNGPITDVCAVYEREVKGELLDVISLDKYDAERQNLIKIDILGLSTMTMIAEALRMLGMKLEELYDIPLDDEAVIDGFRRNDITGIFQFDGRAMRSVNAELKPDSFKEICDVNALARPGPLHNNASASYVEIKRGEREPERLHPIYDAIAEETHFQIVYQEQILRVVREIGNFDWTHAAYIRKIISKKLGEQEFRRQFDRFWEGAQTHGISKELAEKIWGLCITAGSYAFNAAHCVSYGMLAYWTMWLKVYHPQVFYVASLMKMPEDKQIYLLRDALKHGIKAVAPDPVRSGISWKTDGEDIIGGLSQVKGIGEKLATRIIEHRDGMLTGFTKWEDMLEVPGVGPSKLEAIKAMHQTDDPYDVLWLGRRIEAVRNACPELGLPYPSHTSLDVPYSRGQDTEVIWAGLIRHRNLRELFELNFSRTGVELDPDTVKDPHLNEWVLMAGYDAEEELTITVDRWKYPRFKKALWGIKLDSDVVVIRGIKRGFQARRAIYVSELWVVDPDS
jgi:DNA polymerase III subunit alpha